ncbi:MAG: cytochrome c peroxidase, partial [Aquabacterium sp.]|nr:cytochrome c peroxidase [Aquabacterium sp.]
AAASAGAVAAPGLLDFSPDERQRILQHGPWPPPPAHDAGNALAGQPAAIALGQRLFFEPRLSPDGRFACASCHVPALAFTDGRPRALGRDTGAGETLDRNTPTLWNAAQQRWYGWDGAFDSLWSQALHPLLHPREMAATPAHLQALLRDDVTLACQWRRLHGTPPSEDAEATLVGLAKALGAFVGTLQSGRTPFDHFRDALARGDRRTAARYPLAAQRGLRLFVGRGQCSTCHGGPLFSNGEFGDIGAPFFVRPGVVDPGRHGGITALRASRYNLLGPFSDAPDDETLRKTRHVVLQHRNFGEFKVPSLRNLAHTAPYLHDGQLATLAAVLDHYSALSPDRLHADGEQILKPLHLSAGERADLLAFLRSLSTPGATAWQAAADGPCTAASARPRMR